MSSCTERKPIGRRTQTNQTPNGIRSDGERNHQGVQLSQLHQQSQQNNLFQLSPLGFAACQSKNCINKANRAIHQGAAVSAAPTKQTEQELHQQNLQISFHEPQPDPRPTRYHAPRSHEQPIAPIDGHHLLAAFHRTHDVRSHMLR